MGLRRALACVVAWKLLLLAAAAAWGWVRPDFFSTQSYFVAYHLDPPDPGSLATRLSTWDGQHYLHLARDGYTRGERSAAFYPLWPLLIRAASPLLGGSGLIAGLLLSHAFFLLACAVLYREVEAQHGARAATAALAALVAYPAAFFFGLVYTESLFLLLGVGLFAALRRDRLGLAAGLAVLLPLTRAVGVFAVLPLAWHAYRACREPKASGVRLRAWAAVAAPLVGSGLYLAWMHAAAGHALAGFEAQALYPSQPSIAKLFDPLGFLAEAVHVRGPLAMRGGGFDRLAFAGFLALLVPVWRRFDLGVLGWTLTIGIVPAVTVGLMSFTRYAAVIVPLFIVVGLALAQPGRERAARFALLLALWTQLLLCLVHTSNYWVG
jgi:hypothetical protein